MSQQIQKQNRKIQISGRCSYIVSLPKKWVTDMGLTQGSCVSISWHNGNSLLMSVDKQTDTSSLERKITILPVSETESPTTTALKIANLYVAGRNSIQLKFTGRLENAAKRSEISELARNQLIGAEVILDSQESLQIEVLLGNSELTIGNALKRLSSVSSVMLEESLDALKTADGNLAQSVIENYEAERFSYYLQRSVICSLGHTISNVAGEIPEPDDLSIYLLISRAFLDSANCAREIARQVETLESHHLEFDEALAVNQLKDFIIQMYHSAILSFFKQDIRAAEKTLELTRQFQRIENDFRSSLGKKSAIDHNQAFALVSVLSYLKKISECSSEVAELVLGLLHEKLIEESEVPQMKQPQVVPLFAANRVSA